MGFNTFNNKLADDYNSYLYGERKNIFYHVFLHTLKACEEDRILRHAVENSIAEQYIVYENDKLNIPLDGPSTNIVVSEKRTLQAASAYDGKKVAILNFANARHPGGNPKGSAAQEESICRSSTLYPCLDVLRERFYDRHYSLDNYANSDIIYTPDVVVFKNDETFSFMLEEINYFKVDVITCAAPHLYGDMDNRYKKVIESRIKRILEVAKKENVEVLILGAFGCGAFNNPPEVVASTFKSLLQQYKFETVEFAIRCNGGKERKNFNAFKEVFNERL